jgi:hypothetical protein
MRVFTNSGITSIIIPEGVTDINSSFSGCGKLTSVTLPASITEISSEAFWGCSELIEINILESVKSVEPGAFFGCSKLPLATKTRLKELGYTGSF